MERVEVPVNELPRFEEEEEKGEDEWGGVNGMDPRDFAGVIG